MLLNILNTLYKQTKANNLFIIEFFLEINSFWKPFQICSNNKSFPNEGVPQGLLLGPLLLTEAT